MGSAGADLDRLKSTKQPAEAEARANPDERNRGESDQHDMHAQLRQALRIEPRDERKSRVGTEQSGGHEQNQLGLHQASHR